MSKDVADGTRHSVKNLTADLRRLGVNEADTLLLRAATRAIGSTEGKPTEALLDACLEALGPNGTLVVLSFSKKVFRWWRHRSPVFTADAPVNSGGFAAAVLRRPGAVRSAHPTSSFAALGRHALHITSGHDHRSTSFAPMQKLIELDAKMALVGCVESSPGFSTVHLAQEHLNLATQSILRGLFGAYHEAVGGRRWFSRRDVPGCSMGFGNFYPLYRARGVLSEGSVGDALSLLISCRDAYAIELDALSRDPRVGLCDDPYCFSCRATRFYNKRDIPGFLIRALVSPRRTLQAFNR